MSRFLLLLPCFLSSQRAYNSTLKLVSSLIVLHRSVVETLIQCFYQVTQNLIVGRTYSDYYYKPKIFSA